MNDILSVITFVMGALCFAVFLTTMRPNASGAVTAQQARAMQDGGFLVHPITVANSNGWER
jgi:hypothetical protein